MREEMALLENALAVVKCDYEVAVLRIEFERTVASNEQVGPIAKELRVSVESLQKTISQHKSEVNRYKVRAHKAEQQLAKVRMQATPISALLWNRHCPSPTAGGQGEDFLCQ